MTNVVIISAKFTPGHISHLAAFYLLFNEMGYNPILLLNTKYEGSFDKDCQIIYLREDFSEYPSAEIALIYNMSTIDIPIVNNIRKVNKSNKTMFVYHEPWYGYWKWVKDVLNKKVKPIVLFKNIGIHQYAKRILKKSDIVLLPSKKAVEVYRMKDIRYNKNAVEFPLIFSNESIDFSLERSYFSFIATADKEKNFPLFISFISKYLNEDKEFKAQIVTRSDISEYWNKTLDQYIEQGRLIVKAGKNLTNNEINEALTMSNCTWLFYYHSTQSGVLARAFMCGSPVIASTVGCMGKYVNGRNVIICESDRLEDLYKTYCLIRSKNKQMSEEALLSYKQFDYSSSIGKMREIINRMEQQ